MLCRQVLQPDRCVPNMSIVLKPDVRKRCFPLECLRKQPCLLGPQNSFRSQVIHCPTMYLMSKNVGNELNGFLETVSRLFNLLQLHGRKILVCRSDAIPCLKLKFYSDFKAGGLGPAVILLSTANASKGHPIFWALKLVPSQLSWRGFDPPMSSLAGSSTCSNCTAGQYSSAGLQDALCFY